MTRIEIDAGGKVCARVGLKASLSHALGAHAASAQKQQQQGFVVQIANNKCVEQGGASVPILLANEIIMVARVTMC
jgi:hypothetical protein